MQEELIGAYNVIAKGKCIILPGNGCEEGTVRDSNWYGWAEDTIRETGLFDEVILRDMPDPYAAREKIWLPFIREELGADKDTVIIGHSSGAEAAMRLLESTPLRGIVLVSACHTDLGDAGERAAGYYNRPWKWSEMKKNVGSFGIHQFHSDNDPFIPIAEARHVAKNTDSSYHELPNRLHFFDAPFPELLEVICTQMSKDK